jgi:hypothetical protein
MPRMDSSKAPCLPAETVVGRAHAVETDADVIVTDGVDVADIILGNQGAVT